MKIFKPVEYPLPLPHPMDRNKIPETNKYSENIVNVPFILLKGFLV